MDTVAIRMPKHPVALRLIEGSGCLIAAPSANTSGKPSPTEASHVALDMDGRIPMILDGGPVGIGIESTIVDLSESTPMILRPGYITQEMLQEVLGEKVCMDPGNYCVGFHQKAESARHEVQALCAQGGSCAGGGRDGQGRCQNQ